MAQLLLIVMIVVMQMTDYDDGRNEVDDYDSHVDN